MNAPTDPNINPRPSNGGADKITSMLRQLDAAAPPPPAFRDLMATADPNRSSRPNWISLGAAASLVAVGVGGLVVLGTRDSGPVLEQPGQSIPAADGTPDPTADPTDSLLVEEPSIGTAPDGGDTDPVGEDVSVGTAPVDVEPAVNNLGDSLIGAALSATSTPLFEVDQPNWVKQYVYGTDELPTGDITTNMLVFVGDGGPTYDQPLINVAVFDASALDIGDFGDPIEVGGVASAINAFADNPESGLTGPTVNLTVPLADGQALRVNTVRLTVDETVAIAEQVNVTTGGIELEAPAGFRQLPFSAPESWRSFSYRWGFDDGTPVPEPVVITSADGSASDTIDRQPSIEVLGENLGPVSLMGRIGLEVRENRVVNGIDVAYRPMPDQPGMYWADWLDGDWSYYVIGQNLDSEEQFLGLLGSLRLTDAETFAMSDVLDIVMPGRYDDVASEILSELDLSAEQLEQASTVNMPTEIYNYRFELNFGLGCVLRDAWLDADSSGDDARQDAILASLEMAARRASETNADSVGLGDSLAAPMRAGNRDEVALFGSNDCPLWSA